jgi:hypothetical protein
VLYLSDPDKMARSEICICVKKTAAQSQFEVGTGNKGTPGTVHEPAFRPPAANCPVALAFARHATTPAGAQIPLSNTTEEFSEFRPDVGVPEE